MAILGNSCTPILTGESARRFLEAKEKADRLPLGDLPEDFFAEFDSFQEKSRKFEAELRKKHSEKVRRDEAGDIQSEG